VLLGGLLKALCGWRWADPLASLVIIDYGIREAIHALRESAQYSAQCILTSAPCLLLGPPTGGSCLTRTLDRADEIFTTCDADTLDREQCLQELHDRCLYFAPISYVSPQKSSHIHAIYH
jgi:hypothetical protein